MAVKKRKPADLKNLNFTPLLYLGLIFIAVGVAIPNLFPNALAIFPTLAYLFGMLALVIYMWQWVYEKRTGRKEKGAESEANRLKGGK